MATELVQVKGGARGFFARAAWSFEAGRQWALVGDDGVAKSRLCALVAGVLPMTQGLSVTWDETIENRVQLVSFAQQRAAAAKGGFRQARYYSIEDEAGPGETVEEFLSFERIYDVNPFEVGRPLRAERAAYKRAFKEVMPLLNMHELLDRDFLALSNGETRRTLLARALLASPQLLVLDDPCAGLDPARRAQVKDICTALAARGLSLLIAVRHEDEIPACVTDVMTLDKGRAPSFRAAEPVQTETNPAAPQVCGAAVADSATDAKPVVELKHIHLEMGSRVLFADFSWTIRQGERWVLRGANGSGKTTLLSLITGDNPQAYANDVSVFGHVRGDGVELARIRRRIGMVSPEQQAYEGRDAFELLESALARKPDLLLLDEPCLNLDARMAARLKRRVSAWLRRHPACTSICVAHRAEDIPEGFTRECILD